ncbi:MAG: rod shape-determining protein RodA, partial [Synergistaceae bacterium]
MSERLSSRWSDIKAYTDYVMLILVVLLFFLGVAAIYSASPASADKGLSGYALRQLIWGGVSAVIYVLI